MVTPLMGRSETPCTSASQRPLGNPIAKGISEVLTPSANSCLYLQATPPNHTFIPL